MNGPCSCSDVNNKQMSASRATLPRVPHCLLPWAQQPLTFSVDPIGVSVRECRAVAELLDGLRGLVVDLEDATRPSPTGRVCFRHLVHTPPTRRIGPRVVGDGPLQEDWGRQLAGVVGNCGKSLGCPARRSDGQFGKGEHLWQNAEVQRIVYAFAVVGGEGGGCRTGPAGRLCMKLRLRAVSGEGTRVPIDCRDCEMIPM